MKIIMLVLVIALFIAAAALMESIGADITSIPYFLAVVFICAGSDLLNRVLS